MCMRIYVHRCAFKLLARDARRRRRLSGGDAVAVVLTGPHDELQVLRQREEAAEAVAARLAARHGLLLDHDSFILPLSDGSIREVAAVDIQRSARGCAARKQLVSRAGSRLGQRGRRRSQAQADAGAGAGAGAALGAGAGAGANAGAGARGGAGAGAGVGADVGTGAKAGVSAGAGGVTAGEDNGWARRRASRSVGARGTRPRHVAAPAAPTHL